MSLDAEFEARISAAVEKATAPLVAALAQPPRLAYSVAEVAQLCGTSPDTVQKWVHNGLLSTVPHTGKRWLIPRISVERLMAEAEAAITRDEGTAPLSRPA